MNKSRDDLRLQQAAGKYWGRVEDQGCGIAGGLRIVQIIGSTFPVFI
jgi:hypothetical protein